MALPLNHRAETRDTAPPADIDDDNTSGKYDNGAFYLLLFLFLLCLILLLRHTVTFLVTTAEGIERYRIKVWHDKRIDPDLLPAEVRRYTCTLTPRSPTAGTLTKTPLWKTSPSTPGTFSTR